MDNPGVRQYADTLDQLSVDAARTLGEAGYAPSAFVDLVAVLILAATEIDQTLEPDSMLEEVSRTCSLVREMADDVSHVAAVAIIRNRG